MLKWNKTNIFKLQMINISLYRRSVDYRLPTIQLKKKIKSGTHSEMLQNIIGANLNTR